MEATQEPPKAAPETASKSLTPDGVAALLEEEKALLGRLNVENVQKIELLNAMRDAGNVEMTKLDGERERLEAELEDAVAMEGVVPQQVVDEQRRRVKAAIEAHAKKVEEVREGWNKRITEAIEDSNAHRKKIRECIGRVRNKENIYKIMAKNK
jgi:ElaB/YqjD/DUF883 family membrane-anchored ribosome-binding protein